MQPRVGVYYKRKPEFPKANITSILRLPIRYLSETVENNWSRSILDMQIGTDLYKRQGKAITNFIQALPSPETELANLGVIR